MLHGTDSIYFLKIMGGLQMKVLLINGSPHAEGSTYTALQEFAVTLEKEGIKTEMLHIGNQAIR